jgi:acyl transferase domain-containing protein/acyl carrier protein
VARQNSERPSSFRVEAALSAITTNSTAVAGRTRQGEEVRARLRGELTELVADTLKFKAARIDANEPLETYGIDSLIVVRLTNELRKRLGKVSSTVFFENRTIAELVEHFAQTREGVLVERYGLSQPAAEEEKLVSSSLSVAPSADPETRDDIAIIGLAGRYPGANDVEEFWANLRDGKSAIGEIPADRWAWQNYYRDARGEPDAMYTRWGGFLTDVDAFDSLFFKISPAEAEKMDPQERLFLETAYASIEDAGYIPAELSKSRRVGVFVGVMNADYSTGAKYWSIANRVSYTFDLHGPSMAVDTACSSSLTAIHLAVESLRNGGCECAIAGGVNIIADPTHYLRLTAMTMLASDDRCKAFGDHADGFVASEGVGAIVLKPLARALADGDVIHGVIKASQVNSGGRTNGYSVPNPNAQAELVADALARSGCDARMVSYIEAHGTGTPLGDPIEVAGLARAFGKQTSDKHYCAIGSVKSNIGHGESVAGIAGLTKVLLQMRHGELVPSLHAETLNPEIHFDDTPFFVQRTRTNWTRPKMAVGGEQREMPRIAGISSFGAGGSNTHLIVAEPPELARIDLYECPSSRLFVLSARSYDRLQAKASQLVAALHSGSYSERDRASIAFTLQTGREPMEARLGFVACSLEEAEILLRRYLDGETTGLHLGNACRSGDTIGVALLDGGLAEVRSGEVLAQWVLGAGVDWARMWGDSMPRRLSLPAYPFAKRRHWLTNEFNHQKEQTMAPTCPPPPPNLADSCNRLAYRGGYGQHANAVRARLARALG